MKVLLVVLVMAGAAWGQATTQPVTSATSDVAQLRAMILSLQKQVADLRAENATLKRQLGAVGGGKAVELKGGTIAEQLNSYVSFPR
jgi:cell division protein FtsB